MESCYHPVLTKSNSPVKTRRQISSRRLFTNPLEEILFCKQNFSFSNYLLYLFTISLVLFDKVGSLFFTLLLPPFHQHYWFPLRSPLLTFRYVVFAYFTNMERSSFYQAFNSFHRRHPLPMVLSITNCWHMVAFCR